MNKIEIVLCFSLLFAHQGLWRFNQIHLETITDTALPVHQRAISGGTATAADFICFVSSALMNL